MSCHWPFPYRPEFSLSMCVVCTWLGNCTLVVHNSAEVSAVCVMMVQGSVVEISIWCFRTMRYAWAIQAGSRTCHVESLT